MEIKELQKGIFGLFTVFSNFFKIFGMQ